MRNNIIFIHGNSGAPQDWEYLISHLEPHFNTFSLSLLGRPENQGDTYSLELLCADCINQIESLKLQSFFLVGHSLGGHIAHQIAAKLKLNCEGIISFGAPPLSFLEFATDAFMPNENASLFSSDRASKELLEKVYFDNFSGAFKSFESFQASYLSTDPKCRTQVFQSVMNAHFVDEVLALREFANPVSFILCENDPFINQEYIKEANQRIENATILGCISSAGHYPHIENSEELYSLMLPVLLQSREIKEADEQPKHP